jgi:2-hydroxychromene-2-carboxylate isomerase
METVVPAVEFFFDYGSPTTYLAWSQIGKIAARSGARVARRPMLLGGVFKATGNASPATVPAKALYMNRDLARFAARYGVPFRMNPHFPINTLAMMRGAVAAEDAGFAEAYDAAIFHAMWVDGKNMGAENELASVLEAIGWSLGDFASRTATDSVKERLKSTTEEAIARGAFGAPTFFVGDEMFFGQDRMDFVEQALAAATSNSKSR